MPPHPACWVAVGHRLTGTWLSSGLAPALSSSTTMALALNAYMSHAGIRLREARPSSTAEKAPSAPDKDKWLPFFPKTKKVTGPPQRASSLGAAPTPARPGGASHGSLAAHHRGLGEQPSPSLHVPAGSSRPRRDGQGPSEQGQSGQRPGCRDSSKPGSLTSAEQQFQEGQGRLGGQEAEPPPQIHREAQELLPEQ